jgi:hypothetical protein
MQFRVPQFLEIEDKIFGPFTFREFVYLAGGAGISFVLFKLLGLTFAIIPILIVAGFSLALTFYKPNNKPFINMVEAGFKYGTQDKLYIWKKYENKISNKQQDNSVVENKEKLLAEQRLRLNSGKLRDLAWSLDILDLKKHNTGN